MSSGSTTTIYQPVSGWQLLNIRELWKFRELLWYFAWRDVKVRYKQTVLGAAWAILQPFMMMIVFTVLFRRIGNVSSGDVPYPVFVFAGLVLWQFFASSVTSASNSVVSNGSVITKVYFPRLLVPLASMGVALLDFAVACSLLVVLMLWYGVTSGTSLLLAPIAVLLCLITATGIGTLIAALNVSFRDFRYTVPFLVQLWLFSTPSVYMDVSELTAAPTSSVQTSATESGGQPNSQEQAAPFLAAAKWGFIHLNPMTAIVAGFRGAALNQPIPTWLFLQAGVTAFTLLVVGLAVFRRAESKFADIV